MSGYYKHHIALASLYISIAQHCLALLSISLLSIGVPQGSLGIPSVFALFLLNHFSSKKFQFYLQRNLATLWAKAFQPCFLVQKSLKNTPILKLSKVKNLSFKHQYQVFSSHSVKVSIIGQVYMLSIYKHHIKCCLFQEYMLKHLQTPFHCSTRNQCHSLGVTNQVKRTC